MLDAGIVEKLNLNDLDTGIYALWWMIVHMPDELIHRIQTACPTQEDYFKARTKIAEDYRGLDLPEAAWTTLLNNRLAYSGVWKANPLGGRNRCSTSLLSRWNPDDLCKRILHISRMADRIKITQEMHSNLLRKPIGMTTVPSLQILLMSRKVNSYIVLFIKKKTTVP